MKVIRQITREEIIKAIYYIRGYKREKNCERNAFELMAE